jgi:D-arabinose 1-dehydrogenase-like Zn-dependent alcohol dehydrogenase
MLPDAFGNRRTAMAGTLKAAIVHQFIKPLHIEQVAIPEPGPGEVLVNVKASGVCHTDLHAASGDWPVKPNLPFIPDHEATRGTVSLVGLPPGEFATPIFDVVLKRITLRGSIVGARKDLSEAIAFAAEGKVRTTVSERRLEDIFAKMKEGQIEGRIVLSQL